jgi:hypothetical protein
VLIGCAFSFKYLPYRSPPAGKEVLVRHPALALLGEASPVFNRKEKLFFLLLYQMMVNDVSLTLGFKISPVQTYSYRAK